MDIICPRCGERHDFDELHGAGVSFAEARRSFQRIGCAALDGGCRPTCQKVENTRTLAAGAMYELLGDDIDGAAAMLEDFEYLGMLD